MTGALGLISVTLLAQVWRPRGFHDDDCEHVDLIHGSPVVDWRELRVLMMARLRSVDQGEDDKIQQMFVAVRQSASEAQKQCPLGHAAVCLIRANLDDASDCIQGLTIQRVLASRWPIFELLQALHRKVGGYLRSCDDLMHPSINWGEFRQYAERFVTMVPPWLSGLSESEAVPEEFNAALGYAQGIVWKGSSAAVANGRMIMDWTNDCELGLLSANAVRAAGVILSDGDVYRIAQRTLEAFAVIFWNLKEVLRSPWPLFGLLATLSLLKKALHDTRLLPSDLSPTDDAGSSSESLRSSVWQAAAAVLRRAGQGDRIVFLTASHTYLICGKYGI